VVGAATWLLVARAHFAGTVSWRSRPTAPLGALLVLVACQTTLHAQHSSEPTTRTASAGGVRLTVAIDRNALLIDDRLRVSMRVEGPRDLLVMFPDLTGRLEGFAVVGQQVGQPPASSESKIWEQVYHLQPETVGDLSLPPLAITYRSAGQAGAERLST
jgi:hypothetical protein